MKAVRKAIIITNATASTKRLLAQEAKILYFARHQHVVHLIHTYFQEMDETEMKFAVIMERADGDLHHHLRPGTSPCVQWFGCLVGVVHHIHALGIRHRDIKPTNVLIKGGRILLADFGISQMGLGKTIPTTYEHRNAARTRQYCAPEVDQGSTRGRAADIFSLGAVFLEMLIALCYPDQMRGLDGILKPMKQIHSSYALHVGEVQSLASNRVQPSGWQGELLQLCLWMLKPDRCDRPTARDLSARWASVSHERLIEACRNASKAEVDDLLREGTNPNTIGAIHFASESGSLDIVRALLHACVHIDARNLAGQTALHCVARNGAEDLAAALLQCHADVDAADQNGRTALHGAAGLGHVGLVRLLLDDHADATLEDVDGCTAIDFATRRHHLAIVDLLREHSEPLTEDVAFHE
ncbi:hypothetical protein LTR35_017516 [Friedmanniomyces endolithicus]|nr:hypothetical protein LTR35_017516 [Friedmanniomyces endolithicus]